MFTLYMQWEAGRKLAPADIQFILTPRESLEMASIFYELDYRNMTSVTLFTVIVSRNGGKAFTTAMRRSLQTQAQVGIRRAL